MRRKSIADVALGIRLVSAKLVGGLKIDVGELMALERLQGSDGICRMQRMTRLQGIIFNDIGLAVVIGDLRPVTMGRHRLRGYLLTALNRKHGIAQEKRRATHRLAGDDRLARSRGRAGVRRQLRRALAVADMGLGKAARLRHVLQENGVATLANVGCGSIDDGFTAFDPDQATSFVRQTYAHASIFHCTSNAAMVSICIIGIFDSK